MSSAAGLAKLAKVLKEVRMRWDETGSVWSDAVSRDFEKNHLELLEHQLKTTITGLERLSSVLAQAKHACE
jgi:hypothetical protein